MGAGFKQPEFFSSRRQERYFRRLRREFPFVYVQTLTHTAGGRPIYAMQIGNGDRKVLLTAGHHANEAITAEVLWRFLFAYCQAIRDGTALCGVDALELYHGAMAYVVPLVDPDGADLVAGQIRPESAEYARAVRIAAEFPDVPFPCGWKANLEGVDLNLNYPAHWELAKQIKAAQGVERPAPRDFAGMRPLDQPETAALAAYAACIRPDWMLALHTQGRVIYPGPREGAPEGSAALGAALAAASGYTVEEVPPESANAGFKDWFLLRFHRPAFTIECGTGENPLPPETADGLCRELFPMLVTALRW